MNELTNTSNHELSSDINTITAEINAYQRIAGEAIFEIGRRLKHVKENDLAHGEFMAWYESIGLTKDFVSKTIRIFDNLPNFETSRNIGLEALYQIATLPPEERDVPHELPSGETKKPEEMTVRELRGLKRRLRQAEQQAEAERKERERLERENEELANREPEVIKEYIEKDTPELRDRSFDTPYGVKLLDEFYEAMDELSKWQQKYAWITSDNDQLKSFVRVDEDMKEEFRKNINMWRTLSEIFDEDDGNIIDAEIININ